MSQSLPLNAEQQAAVEARERAVAILAGPGSGKTRVLSYRARHLLLNDAGSKALLLTFTNKAAAEMKSRALGVATVGSDRVQSHTYHSLCMRLLRAHGDLVGVSPDFEVLDQDEQEEFAEEAARLGGVHNRSRDWSKQRLRCLLPTRPVAEFGAAYEKAKRQAGVVDFDDLIVYTAALLQQHRQVAEAYGAKYAHLLIDEFQDTNAAQFAVIQALAEPARTVSVFADDDQAIFRFAGAETEHLRRFCDDLQARQYPLTINYRCPQEIVEVANRLILSDQTSSGREMTAKNSGGEVRLLAFDSMEVEASVIASEIDELIKAGVPSAGIAVLVRSGYRAEVLLDCLNDRALPTTNWLARFGNRSARRALRACLSIVRPSLHERNVKELCRVFGLDDTGERDTAAFLDEFQERPGVKGLLRVHELALSDASPIDVVHAAHESLRALSAKLADAINPLVESVNAFHSFDPEFSLDHVLSELALLSGSGSPTETGGIKVASLHRTKGLQWPHVYLVGMEDGHMPDYRARDEEQLREERRLCFVGVCRAQERLTLTRVRESQGYSKPPSLFLSEMFDP